MIQVFGKANFKFMWGRKWGFLAFSAVVTLGALGLIVFKGFNYGIDFAGGTAVQVRFSESPRLDMLRSGLERAGLGDVTLQRIGNESDNEILIRVEHDPVRDTEGEGGGVSQKVLEALRSLHAPEAADADRIDLNTASELGLKEWIAGHTSASSGAPVDAAAAASAIIQVRNKNNGLLTDMSTVTSLPGLGETVSALLKDHAMLGGFALRGVDFVGPTAGKELLQNTGWAILGSVVGILIYVWFRFHRMTWGVAAVVALVHDVSIAAGAMALTGKDFSLPIVASLLTILGYSINDTIVVFDRIRENLRLYRDVDFERVVNASVNQTLSRTILTSFTVFIAVTALFLYGGEKLNPMSFCLMVGVVFGTYSSIFVAASLLVVAYQYLGASRVKS